MIQIEQLPCLVIVIPTLLSRSSFPQTHCKKSMRVVTVLPNVRKGLVMPYAGAKTYFVKNKPVAKLNFNFNYNFN